MPIETTIFSIIVLLFSVVVHEVAHGATAYYLGDPTAKNAGRLTLNPLPHLDLLGSFLIPLLLLIFTAGKGPIFGWAKPVPVNPYNLRDPKWDNIKVSLAGPASNITLALFFGLLIRFFPLPESLLSLFSIIVIINLLLALFNLIPIPPLDGSHLLLSFWPNDFLYQYGFLFLIIFIFFGMPWVFLGVRILYSLITGYPIY